MPRKQVTTTPYANESYHLKPKKTPRKENVVLLTSKPDRSSLTKPRNGDMQKFPTSTISQLNWKSASNRSLTQEAI